MQVERCLLLKRFVFLIFAFLRSLFLGAVWFVSNHPGIIVWAFLIAGVGSLYWANFASGSWRQEMTLSVSTPDGVVKGSSIVKISAWKTPYFLNSGGDFTSIEGEALMMDLGDDKLLFALLDGQNYALIRALRSAGKERISSPADGLRIFRNQDEPLVIDMDDLPTLVTFSNINDPKTIALVFPEDMAASFGEGYTFLGATVRASKKPITQGRVGRLLPCLNSSRNCIGLNENLPHSDPLRSVGNAKFLREPK